MCPDVPLKHRDPLSLLCENESHSQKADPVTILQDNFALAVRVMEVTVLLLLLLVPVRAMPALLSIRGGLVLVVPIILAAML